MKTNIILFLGAIFFLSISGISCRKSQINNVTSDGIPERGGLALTFDDYNIDNWFSYIGLLDSAKVKCTFYVSNYNKLSTNQKEKLLQLQDHGHEIAFHSSNHKNFVEKMQSHGFKKLMEEEIVSGLQLMHNDGLFPKTFAYPYGAHNLIMDKVLLKKFKSVRTLNGTHDLNNSLCPLSGNTVIRGLGIDESSKRSLSGINTLLSSASELNHCAVLLIHNIEAKRTNLQLPLWKFRNILVKAKSLHLHFYTVSEISK